jgi:hypothetical protein
MHWCVIRHPELGAAVVAEPSLVVHKPRGWVRVSEFATDRDSLHVADYSPDFPDLDAEPSAATQPDAGQDQPAAKAKAPAGKRAN